MEHIVCGNQRHEPFNQSKLWVLKTFFLPGHIKNPGFYFLPIICAYKVIPIAIATVSVIVLKSGDNFDEILKMKTFMEPWLVIFMQGRK